MRTLVLVSVGLLSTTRVSADPKADASKLIREAVSVIEARCTRGVTCTIPPSVLQKYRAAYTLDPDPAHASALCRTAFARGVHHSGEILMLCDAAATLGHDKDAGLSAHRIRSHRRSLASTTAASAARALYGFGLDLKETANPEEATLAYGGLTDAQMQEIIRDHYTKRFSTFDDLRDPNKKLAACLELARLDAERRISREFCTWAAVLEANAVPLAFGGASGLERVPQPHGRVFVIDGHLRYRPAFVLASTKKQLDTPEAIMLQQSLLESIINYGASHPKYKEAVALKAKIEAVADRYKAAAEKRYKAARANKTRVTFWPRQPKPERADVPEPIADHIDSCEGVYITGPDVKFDYDLVLQVDGKVCSDTHGWDAFLRSDHCKDRIAAPGKHRVVVELYRTKWHKTGTKRVTVHSKDTIDVRDEEVAERGKRFARAQITCGG